MDTTLTSCEIDGRDKNIVLVVEISAVNFTNGTKPTESMGTMS
jgi:hypothetical protein